MWDKTTRMGMVFRHAGIHDRKCCGQKKTVLRGGGRLAFAPDVSIGALTSFHFVPVRCGSSCEHTRAPLSVSVDIVGRGGVMRM